MDVGTLASLLGHSKLVMVMLYVHPGEQHRMDAVKKLAIANAAKEIAETERLGTVLGTAAQNQVNFSEEKSAGKSNQIN